MSARISVSCDGGDIDKSLVSLALGTENETPNLKLETDSVLGPLDRDGARP